MLKSASERATYSLILPVCNEELVLPTLLARLDALLARLDGNAEVIFVDDGSKIKARPGTVIKSAHVGMAASNTYVLLTEVLPLAIKKYGGFDADALRRAALSVDLSEGGTMLGFGVKFGGDETSAPGQNDRAFPVIIQYIDDKSYVVWPKSLQVREPVLPLPASSPYAER